MRGWPVLAFMHLVACAPTGAGLDPTDPAAGSPSEPADQLTDHAVVGVLVPQVPPGPTERVPEGCTVRETWAVLGTFWDAWQAPSGEVFAIGERGVTVRGLQGVWRDELLPDRALALAGHAASDVWVLGTEALHHRDAGRWSSMPLPRGGDFTVPLGLALRPGGGVVVIDTESHPEATFLDTWDGTRWTRAEAPPVYGSRHAAAPLPDGRLAVAGFGIHVEQADGSWTAIGGPTYDAEVVSGPSGAVVGFSHHRATVWVGGEHGLVEEVLSAEPLAGVSDVWVGGAGDIWVAGHVGAHVGARRGVVWHRGAEGWREVGIAADALYGISGGPEGVLAVGGDTRRLAVRVAPPDPASGDAEGLVVDLQVFGVDRLVGYAWDDVTGVAHAFGRDTVAVDRGSGWEGRPSPVPPHITDPFYGDPPRIDAMAATAGRVAYQNTEGWRHVVEPGGELRSAPPPEEHLSLLGLTGREGVLFSFGYAGGRGGGPRLYRNEGDGWERLGTEALPPEAQVSAVWAEAPGDVWVGFGSMGSGGLAHWDGDSLTILASGLPGAPGWMAREPARELLLGVGWAIFRWTGGELVPDLDWPDQPRAGYPSSDKPAMAWAIGGSDPPRSALWAEDTDGWSVVARDVHAVASGRHRLWATTVEDAWTPPGVEPDSWGLSLTCP